jgi:hypothetical protein
VYDDLKYKSIFLASHITTQNEVITTSEKAIGRKLEVTKVTGAQIVTVGKVKLTGA